MRVLASFGARPRSASSSRSRVSAAWACCRDLHITSRSSANLTRTPYVRVSQSRSSRCRYTLHIKGLMTPPTQLATSALRCRWVIGVSNCRGVPVRRRDMSSSMLVTCLLVVLPVTVALVVTCSPSGSTPPRTCWTRGCRQPTPRESWPAGSAVRPGRRTATCSAPAGPDMLRCPPRPRCSPSSCRCRSSRGSVPMPPRRGGRCPPWSRRRWRSSEPDSHGAGRAVVCAQSCHRPGRSRDGPPPSLHPNPCTSSASPAAAHPGCQSDPQYDDAPALSRYGSDRGPPAEDKATGGRGEVPSKESAVSVHFRQQTAQLTEEVDTGRGSNGGFADGF